jgi:predicted CopG family antitoxin
MSARRHTITINDEAFEKLKRKGTFGETYSDLIVRIIFSLESNGVRKQDAK